MPWLDHHELSPNVSFDGGTLDCGNGLLLLIRKHLDPLSPGELLEIRSQESSVDEDLPAWCRLTKNQLVSAVKSGNERSFLVCKGKWNPDQIINLTGDQIPSVTPALPSGESALTVPETPIAIPPIPPLAVMGIGSWPRPRWLMTALHDFLEGRLPAEDFQQTADDAVRLAIAAQERAGVDVITDGEQRRDSYASFVGSRLENCQLVPITDLLAYVDDPEKFEEELRSLDVPAAKVRHPAVWGPLRRTKPLAVHELHFARSVIPKPIKIALPGPYLLTRTLWMDCIPDKAYATREPLVEDIIRILREEISELLDHGATLVQLDEPVLSEVVFGQPQTRRSFMCGALAERQSPNEELSFAAEILQRVISGFPRERLALHVCRGNWSRDESIALVGDYRPLLPLFQELPVGTLFLESATPRAGEMEILRDLPATCKLALGMVNQKLDAVEPVDQISRRMEQAIKWFGADRLHFTPDCGFATFADNPIASAQVAEAKLHALRQAVDKLK